MSAKHAFTFHQSALDVTQERQTRAAAPDRSVWVAASAGTGKTKVLTDRILRLLLAGAAPEEILCLTYTKAAAAEMAGRLAERLTAWVTQPLDKLCAELAAIGVKNPDAAEQTARQLFARVLDCAGGLKIQTLHGFCQSVLARFPLEAGLTPGFTVLEEQRGVELRAEAFNAVVTTQHAKLADALRALHVTVGEHNLRELLAEDSAANFIAAPRERLAALLNIDATDTADGFYRRIAEGADEQAMRALVRACIDSGGANAGKFAAQIEPFLATEPRQRDGKAYAQALFTKKDELYAVTYVAAKAVMALLPNAYDIYKVEAERVMALLQNAKRAAVLDFTAHYATLRTAIDTHYTRAKRALAAVDYDDLIRLTEKLLTTSGNAAWVMYKLDHQIRHILVDEAQDTSPAQWAILDALAAEFTAGEGAERGAAVTPRTLFVVGDEKQSIYSFNGADPDGFVRERTKYQWRFQQAGLNFDDVALTYSFRSVSAVLNTANTVFAADDVRHGVSGDWLEHLPARSNDAGVVEVWPLLKTDDDKTDANGWVLPAERTANVTASIKLANAIAARIEQWLKTGEMLESRGRAITPQDIMVLVQKRGSFMQQIVQALKKKDIPVAGVDRLTLIEQLAVQDMMALVQFVLLPDDDLNLAALLKCPLFGFDEQQLFDVCYARRGSVWATLRDSKHTAVVDYLSRVLKFAEVARPYEFLQSALRDVCPAGGTGWHAFRARMGGEVMDPLNELLNEALAFEASHTPTLQGFLRHLTETALQKKRELSQAVGEVRVMTAHASKGLQAPIVFLADAAAPPEIKVPRVLGDAHNKVAPSFYVPSASYMTPEVEERQVVYKQKCTEEYRRLMYVAMTRAEDRLIVCGIENKKNVNREAYKNWHMAIETALQPVAEQVEDAIGTVLRYTQRSGTAAVAEVQKTTETKVQLPAWALQSAPAEPAPARPLAPSQIADVQVPVQPPFVADDTQRFAAGTLTHKLLEVLPEISPAQRARVMEKICAEFTGMVSAERMATACAEVQKILNDATFASLFGAGSMAEVPLVGLVNGHAINGQIDRLLVTDTHVLVVDYKTNRPPPVDVAAVPEGYITQLACYAEVLKKIYKNRQIRCALLWTDAPRLMEIPADLMATHLP